MVVIDGLEHSAAQVNRERRLPIRVLVEGKLPSTSTLSCQSEENMILIDGTCRHRPGLARLSCTGRSPIGKKGEEMGGFAFVAQGQATVSGQPGHRAFIDACRRGTDHDMIYNVRFLSPEAAAPGCGHRSD